MTFEIEIGDGPGPELDNLVSLEQSMIDRFCCVSGFEISDVLRISDKDYSITFGLYFSVEWFEPRLNLSRELWGSDRADTELIPGMFKCQLS